MQGNGFEASIDGALIRCTITSAADMESPVFCFSLLTTPAVVSGGDLVRRLGGYAEVQLPNLKSGEPHTLVLCYENPDYRPVNRAWLPLGAYLRCNGRTYELPPLPAGVRPRLARDTEHFAGLRLVPPPTEWMPSGGTIRIATVATHDERLCAVDALSQRCGLGSFIDETGHPLEIAVDNEMPSESYRLDITQEGATITSSDDAGLHYGAISLLVLRATYDGELPCGTIFDNPRFSWRGQHLDCARHFYQTKTLGRLLDLMALFKMNRFHWHFSDDEAFRLQVECAPEIWEQTQFRGEGQLLPGVFGGGVRSGGSYSKADAKAIVKHAADLHIGVLPEIEFPAHALSLAMAVPELRDPDDTGKEESVQAYPKNVVNPACAQTWDLFEALSLEVAELFPLGILHLGCDELPEDTWNGSPLIEQLKAEQGLETRDDVQAFAMRRLASHLKRHGIRPAAWEEAARGLGNGVEHGTLLFSWTGQGPGIEAARAGYDVIMSPAQNVYLDMAHTSDPDDWGAAWAGFVELDDTINWDVITDPDLADRIKGVEGTFWSEFTTIDRQIEPMLAPRILGVATQAWSQPRSISAEDLRALAYAHGPIFDAMGWEWRAP